MIGTFAGLPQNSLLFVDGHPFRISYTGGDGNDVVLTALAQPAFSISDVTVTEGESGSVNAVFTVSTPHTPFQTVGVQFTTVNGTAASPQDFTAHSGTLTFLPGTTSQTVTIAVHGDDTAEATETFIVRLSGAQGGATIDDEDGVGTIETDDEAPAPLTYFLAEGATGPFFDNDVLIANPNVADAPVTLTFFTQQGAVIAEQRTIAGRTRATIHVDQIPGLEDAAVSVRGEVHQRPAADRRTHDVLGCVLLRRSHRHRGGTAGRALVLRGSGAGLLRHLRARHEREPDARRSHGDVPARGRNAGRQDGPGRRLVARDDWRGRLSRAGGTLVRPDRRRHAAGDRRTRDVFRQHADAARGAAVTSLRASRRRRPRGSTRKARPARSSTRSSCSAIRRTIRQR